MPIDPVSILIYAASLYVLIDARKMRKQTERDLSELEGRIDKEISYLEEWNCFTENQKYKDLKSAKETIIRMNYRRRFLSLPHKDICFVFDTGRKYHLWD